jgi:hypothetical protein
MQIVQQLPKDSVENIELVQRPINHSRRGSGDEFGTLANYSQNTLASL